MKTTFNITNFRLWSLLCVITFLSSSIFGREEINVSQVKHTFVYNGDSNLSIGQIAASTDYTELSGSTPNLGVSDSHKFLKFFVHNDHSGDMSHAYFLNTSIDSIELYKMEDKLSLIGYDGCAIPYSERLSQNTGFLFDLKLNPDEGSWYLCKLYSGKQLIVPVLLGNEISLIKKSAQNDNFMSLYFGIILVLIVYNFFLGISTKDNEYYYYVAYLLSVGLTQAALFGYGNKILWPYSSWLSVHSVHLTGALSGVFTILFARKFVQSKRYSPIVHKILWGYIGISFLSIGFLIAGNLVVSYNLINFNAASSFLLLLAGIISARKGFHSARYFVVAWSVFLFAVTVFALKDFGVLPLNAWTTYSLPIGSALEGILLSFALAGKINTLKKEKEQANAELLETVQNQNEILEIKVHERTEELEQAKNKIQVQFDDLRVAQKQLVESEKMAGLGQMTAGIAHELNNPINFVSSNVAPLHRDVQDIVNMLDDYTALGDNFSAEDIHLLKEKHEKIGIDFIKKEIDALLKGIEEGSRRTAEIVKGLRVFSRTDKDELVSANLNDCLQSTLVVLKSVTKGQVTLTKEFDPQMPDIYCFPGKLNQVIANLVTNAVYAVNLQGRTIQNRQVHVCSYFDEQNVYISVKDNGMGIEQGIMEKIFMPFFTTKGVGDGTGLGLSITMGIVEEHNGHIEVLTEKGIGSEFIIHLPRLENSRQPHTAA